MLVIKSKSPSYTALTLVVPTARVEVVKVATPPVIGDCPSGSNTTASPFGGAGVTVAVKVTAWPEVEGFTEDVSVVVVAAAAGFTSNTVPYPSDPPW